MSDGIPQSNVIQSPIHADVANRGKARLQHFARVGNRLQRHLCRCLLQLRKWVTIVGWSIRQMSVTINQARKHRHLGKINHLGVCWNRQILSDCLNLILMDQNHLIGQYRTCLGIDQPSGLDRDRLRDSNVGTEQAET